MARYGFFILTSNSYGIYHFLFFLITAKLNIFKPNNPDKCYLLLIL